MSRRPPAQHLSEVVENHGTGNASKEIVALLTSRIEAANNKERAERVASKGTDEKVNPYVTDTGKCPRQVFFSLTNVPQSEPLTIDSLINFGVGHAVEEWLAATLAAEGGEILRELRVEIPIDGTVVSGRADFLVAMPELHTLIELKTTSSRSMGWMLRRQEAGKADHRKQLNCYLLASHLNLLPYGPFNRGYLIYCVKDATKGEPPIHAFHVDFDEKAALADLDMLAGIARAARIGSDPGRPQGYTKSKYPCSYCSWKTACYDN